jgi:hypothetical protein
LVVDHLPLRDFGPYGIIFMNMCFVITIAMLMRLKGFSALWDNIYDNVRLPLYIFPSFLTGNLVVNYKEQYRESDG